MHEISIQLDYYDKYNVGCLDPTKVINFLKQEFSEVVVSSKDYSRKDYDYFRKEEKSEGAIQTALNDCLRRGPIWKFEIKESSVNIRGYVERYVIQMESEGPFSEKFKLKIENLVKALSLPHIDILE